VAFILFNINPKEFLMENVLKLLADLLTDQLDGVALKTRALEIYVELRTRKEDLFHNYIFTVPCVEYGTGREYVLCLHISPADYEKVRSLVKSGEKIQAIKHLRMTSLINGNKDIGSPGLKECKDFVENHDWK
jgi:predicted RNA-binding protein YlqC (UPF0109 family)